MAKDPAFLFYPNDYIGGTMGMTFEQKGAYIELLILQFNSGPFTTQQVTQILGLGYPKIWPVLQKKFIFQDGHYYNERLEKEKARRKKFVEKQAVNGEKGGRPKAKQKPAPNPNGNPNGKPDETNKENENENRNLTDFSLGGAGGFSFDETAPLPAATLEAAEMNQHTHTGTSNTEFVKSQWKVFLKERMNDPPNKKVLYRQVSDLTSYFLNFLRDKFPKHGPANKQATFRNNKSAGAEQLINELKKDFGANQ